MLHRVLATLLCVLGAAAIGLGVASATLWRASDTLVASAEAVPGTTMMVTDPGVLDLAAEEVTVEASTSSGDAVVIALARTSEVEAWVGADPYTRVTGLADLETLAVREGEAAAEPETGATGTSAPTPSAEATEETTEEAAEDPAATSAPDPTGADLWVEEVSDPSTARLGWTAEPGRWSVLVASTGADAGPPSLTLTWPQEVTTPWLVPGVVVGSVLLLLGAAWWAFILVRGRRTPAPAVPRGAPASAGAAPVPASVGVDDDTHVMTPAAAGTVPAGAVPTGSVPATGLPSEGERAGTGEIPAVPGGPLTRRQLRELEQQRLLDEKAARRGEPSARFPLRTAGPAGRPTSGAPDSPEEQAVAADAVDAAGLDALRPSESEAETPSGEDATQRPGPVPAWARRIADRLPGRASAGAAPDPTASAAPSQEGTDGAAPDAPADGPATPAAPTWPPRSGASASAWRQTWGFGASGTATPTGEDGRTDAPGGGTTPGRAAPGPDAPTEPDAPTDHDDDREGGAR